MMIEEVAICGLVEECLDRKREKAREKGIYLDAEREELQEICRADRRLLRAAIINMIEAVISYSRAGSCILVGHYRDDTRERIYVSSDDGSIPFEELRTIRDLFCRQTVPEAWEVEELQAPLVSLSLVKDIADLHGGKVGVQSSEGEGVTLTLYLPRRQRGAA
jgi:two-component system phosphate regulon sensor histidine kinase PhoR